MDSWIFPNPECPDRIERVILVDMDARDPLRDDQVEALSVALHQMIKDRNLLSERIQKVSQRLVLSGEEKVKAMRAEENNGS